MREQNVPAIPAMPLVAADGGGKPDDSGAADAIQPSVPGGGQGDSPASGGETDSVPRFDIAVPPNGYAWWYVGALSADGTRAITLAAFIGSVFSPYYAWARRRGPADPENFCALNVTLYGPRGKRWAMTERGRAGLQRDATNLAIGPSALHWDGTVLTISMDEVTTPLPRRLRGFVRVIPAALTGRRVMLDGAGRHRWVPLAPISRVEVEVADHSWSGDGYLDMNAGDAPLEQDFSHWNWCCARVGDGAAIIYDVTMRSGENRCLCLRVDGAGGVETFAPPPPVLLPRTRWRVARGVRSEDGTAELRRTFEDAPFYARSEVAWQLGGKTVVGTHESLSLDRLRSDVVQAMLPLRIPRRAR